MSNNCCENNLSLILREVGIVYYDSLNNHFKDLIQELILRNSQYLSSRV